MSLRVLSVTNTCLHVLDQAWLNINIQGLIRNGNATIFCQSMKLSHTSSNAGVLSEQFKESISKNKRLQRVKEDLNLPANEVEEALTWSEDDFNLYESIEGPQFEVHKKARKHKLMEKKRRRGIIQKKYFPPPKVDNLLTWSAKEQMRYLNKQYPDEWTVDRLAQSFPCTVDQAKEVLRKKVIMYGTEDIERHDNWVKKTWTAIADGRVEDLHTRTVNLLRSGELRLTSASGIPSLPMPPKDVFETRKPPSGIFSLMIKDHSASDDPSTSIHHPAGVDRMIESDQGDVMTGGEAGSKNRSVSNRMTYSEYRRLHPRVATLGDETGNSDVEQSTERRPLTAITQNSSMTRKDENGNSSRHSSRTSMFDVMRRQARLLVEGRTADMTTTVSDVDVGRASRRRNTFHIPSFRFKGIDS